MEGLWAPKYRDKRMKFLIIVVSIFSFNVIAWPGLEDNNPSLSIAINTLEDGSKQPRFIHTQDIECTGFEKEVNNTHSVYINNHLVAMNTQCTDINTRAYSPVSEPGRNHLLLILNRGKTVVVKTNVGSFRFSTDGFRRAHRAKKTFVGGI